MRKSVFFCIYKSMTDKRKNMLRGILSEQEKPVLIERIFALIEKLEEKQAYIGQLEDSLIESKRASKRQAAPFRIPKKKRKDASEKKRPGRKGGHQGNYRELSAPINEEIDVPLCGCPHCQGDLSQVEKVEQIIEEIPQIKLRVIKLTTYKGNCEHCGEIHSTHPLQVSHAQGSAKVQLGPNAISMGIKLHHYYGITLRKTCKLLTNVFNLPLSPGGLVHLEHRIANKLLPDYEQLREQAKASSHVHADETSWYVGSPGDWLWVFTNPNFTLYDIDPTRSRSVVHRNLGQNYQGILISDCLSVYDGLSEEQHKCYSHHLKVIKDALEIQPNSSFLLLVKKLLQKAIAIKSLKGKFKPPDYDILCQNVEEKANELLPYSINDKGNYVFELQLCPFKLTEVEQKIARRIVKQRPHLFTFLKHDHIPATNNLAERQLRPAVIQRKISCGNKTQKGAHTWKVLRSIAVTDQQQDRDFSYSIYDAIKGDL